MPWSSTNCVRSARHHSRRRRTRFFGVGLVLVGVLLLVAATISHVRTVHRLNSGEPFVGRPTWVGITVAVVLAVVGSLMSVYLLRET